MANLTAVHSDWVTVSCHILRSILFGNFKTLAPSSQTVGSLLRAPLLAKPARKMRNGFSVFTHLTN
jgi:hypothetical protein